MRIIALCLLCLFACACASQTEHVAQDGTVTYHTAEVLHKSELSAQWKGTGQYSRTTSFPDGRIVTDSITTQTSNATASVRVNPDGVDGPKSLAGVWLTRFGIRSATQLGLEAIE